MKISDIKIRAIRHEIEESAYNLKDGTGLKFEFLAMTFKTDEDVSVDVIGFAGRDAEGIGHTAENVLKPFFLGRDPYYRELHWHDFRKYDRTWHFTPIYSYAPFDIACHLIAAEKAGLPLYKYLGAYRDEVPVYGSSLTLDTPEKYAAEAKEQQEEAIREAQEAQASLREAQQGGKAQKAAPARSARPSSSARTCRRRR